MSNEAQWRVTAITLWDGTALYSWHSSKAEALKGARDLWQRNVGAGRVYKSIYVERDERRA